MNMNRQINIDDLDTEQFVLFRKRLLKKLNIDVVKSDNGNTVKIINPHCIFGHFTRIEIKKGIETLQNCYNIVEESFNEES